MHSLRSFVIAAAFALSLSCALVAIAEGPASEGKSLLELTAGKPELAQRVAPSSALVTVDAKKNPAAAGLVVSIQPGKESFPGVAIKPENGPAWDLSTYGHVEVKVTNLGAGPLALTLRVDNAGDWRTEPWNAEQSTIQAGETASLATTFGYSYGHKNGYKLNAAKVNQVLVFAGKSDAVQSFRIESLKAAGTAGEKLPVDPKAIRTKPAGGILLGDGVAIDVEKQVHADGARASLEGGEKGGLLITFEDGHPDAKVALKPPAGRWDLRDAIEVRVRLRNAGSAPITPRVCLDCGGATSDWIAATRPLTAGAEQVLTVEFAGTVPWRAIEKLDRTSWTGQPNTGSRITSDAVSAVMISADHAPAGAALRVESIVAGLASDLKLPGSLGQRPPVGGDWVKTFDDEFNGTTLDLSKWNDQGNNYYDDQSHWSKNNVIVGGGVARLHYEKKKGRQNDSPAGKETNYASGYLDTFGKWTQRYGYFESRMKLPRAPGLWPAFWMMPDRGAKAAHPWERGDTANGGMEFDIMEHLTRWGPNRYNIAFHWDGYGKSHKQTGTEKIYLQPDKDGFIVSGILWTPGLVVIYGNGHEVARMEDPRVASVPADMMFTLPMGGWDNNELDDARLPADFEIDYVRVWQRRDLIEKRAEK
ncbi:MAG TPA: glycoside hydrolase family 16 protein [Tepidisphaeraceae bacterium]|jgi:beta-glucanase (GH16 family)|nr:glycoside hydrolase family 16 protein [Tepidisphaeraceae bacterium]